MGSLTTGGSLNLALSAARGTIYILHAKIQFMARANHRASLVPRSHTISPLQILSCLQFYLFIFYFLPNLFVLFLTWQGIYELNMYASLK